MAMTLNTNSLVGSFDPNVTDGGPSVILKQAIGDDPESLNRLLSKGTFKAKVTSTTAVNALNVVLLKAAGVPFPVDSVRAIRTKVWMRKTGADKAAYAESLRMVLGKGAATAPVLTPTTAFTGNSAGNDPAYVARTPIVGNAAVGTANFIVAALTISSTDVAVRIATLTGSGLTTGAKFDVEVEIGELHILPSA